MPTCRCANVLSLAQSPSDFTATVTSFRKSWGFPVLDYFGELISYFTPLIHSAHQAHRHCQLQGQTEVTDMDQHSTLITLATAGNNQALGTRARMAEGGGGLGRPRLQSSPSTRRLNDISVTCVTPGALQRPRLRQLLARAWPRSRPPRTCPESAGTIHSHARYPPGPPPRPVIRVPVDSPHWWRRVLT